jgi:hypothetical protein
MKSTKLDKKSILKEEKESNGSNGEEEVTSLMSM